MNDETRAFSNRFLVKAGRMPTMIQAGVYSAVMHYLKAIDATGTDAAEAVIAKMKATPIHDFFANNGRIREDGRRVHDMYLMQVKSPAESQGPWDVYKLLATVPDDEAYRPLADGDCALVKKESRRTVFLPIEPLPRGRRDRLFGISSTRFKPRERVILFREVKLPDLCLNEVTGDARHDLQEPAVGHGSNAFDLSMVIGDELQVRHECSEALPAGKRPGVDHDASELALRGNKRIDLPREFLEVRLLERAIGRDDQDVSVAQQLKMNHGSPIDCYAILFARYDTGPVMPMRGPCRQRMHASLSEDASSGASDRRISAAYFTPRR